MARFRILAIAAAAAALTAALVGPRAVAGGTPANKMVVAGSTMEVMTADITTGTDSKTETLLSGTIRASNGIDLILQVAAECALWTDTKNVGDSDSEAIAQVKLWVTIDGKPVGVNSADETDDGGRVVFCDRAFRNVMTGFTNDDDDDDDSTETIELFMKTRSAHAFNWIKLNVPRGIHSIAVVGQLDVEVKGVGHAKALVGRRTLVVEPTHLASNVISI